MTFTATQSKIVHGNAITICLCQQISRYEFWWQYHL